MTPMKRHAQAVFQAPRDVPGLRISKKGRRESASAVDEFFNTGGSARLNLSVNMNIALVRGTDTATNVNSGQLTSRAQSRTDVSATMRSDGIIEELFGPIPSMVAEMSSWPMENAAPSPCPNVKMTLPDMSSLSFTMQSVANPPVDNFGCIPLSRQISDSLWEDLSQTIDGDDLELESSDNRTSKTNGNVCNTGAIYPASDMSSLVDNNYLSNSLTCCPADLVTVKAEPMDIPASCTFQTLQRTDVASLQAINVKLESASYNSSCLGSMSMTTSTSMSTNTISRPKFLPVTPQTSVGGSQNIGASTQQGLSQLKAAIASALTPATPSTYAMYPQGMVQHSSMPPTPPHSGPNSPNDDVRRHTPPPPYTSDSQTTTPLTDGPVMVPLTPVTHRPRLTHPGCTTIKYNRRNNPDLEKRRIHFCDFPGKSMS